jgi:hypothetical protein
VKKIVLKMVQKRELKLNIKRHKKQRDTFMCFRRVFACKSMSNKDKVVYKKQHCSCDRSDGPDREISVSNVSNRNVMT